MDKALLRSIVLPSLFIAFAITVTEWITGKVGPALNIKQAVAVEIIYLAAMAVWGWFDSEYPEEFARFISAFGRPVGAAILQVGLVCIYYTLTWVMAP